MGSRTRDQGPRIEDWGQGTHDWRPRIEDPGQRIQDRGPRIEDPEQRTQDRGPRTEDPGLKTQNRGPRTEDQGARIGLRTYWSRTVDESKPLMNKFQIDILTVYEILPVAGMAQCTLPWGFFSGYSSFPHSWKTNIFKFQFNKIGNSLLWTNWDEMFDCL